MAQSFMLFLPCLFFFFSLAQVSTKYAHGSSLVPALYIFGDSTVDPGNNNHLPTLAKANFLPYGIDFNNTPTGRFTNGKTIADFIAELLGLPLAPAYLGLSELQRSKVTTGINYGSGSCGILTTTGKVVGNCLDLDRQIDLFESTVKQDLPKRMGEKDLKRHLSKSIVFVSAGGNDFIFNNMTAAKKPFSPDVFGQFLANQLSKRLQRLYGLGARKFLLNSVGRIGCLPLYTSRVAHRGECVEQLNEVVLPYTKKLPQMLQQLQSQLSGSAFTHSDNFKLFKELKATPQRYGITDTENPCCPAGGNGSKRCQPNVIPCKIRRQHLFFDDTHTAEVVNEFYARNCFNVSSMCTPLTLIQLVTA